MEQRYIYYNYYYHKPKYSMKLNKVLKDLYLNAVDVTPRGISSAIDCFTYNLIRIVKFEYDSCYYVAGKNTHIGAMLINGRSVESKMSRSNTTRLIDVMDELGYLAVQKGFRVNAELRESSCFFINESLIKLVLDNVDMSKVQMQPYENVLILKDTNKQPRAFMQTAKVKQMIKDVEDFNKELQRHVIRYNGVKRTVSFQRIFNDDSFELGGRLYTHNGDIQTLSSNKRKQITIDNEVTSEVDLKALHLAILYEIRGETWYEGFDPYNAFVVTSPYVDTDELEEFVDNNGLDHRYNPIRNLCKIATLVMVNAPDRQKAKGAILKKFKDDRKKKGTLEEADMMFAGIVAETLDIDDVIDQLMEHNDVIEDDFNSGKGKALQFKDSEIMLGVVKDFITQGKVCLPIHDSVIVKLSDQGFAIQSMVRNYEKVLGTKDNCFIDVKW